MGRLTGVMMVTTEEVWSVIVKFDRAEISVEFWSNNRSNENDNNQTARRCERITK